MSVLAVVHVAFSLSLLLYSITLRDAHGRDIYNLFKDFVHKYNKSYVPGTLEYVTRESIFKSSLERIDILNQYRTGTDSAIYGINEFSDLTPEEFKDKMRINRFNATAGTIKQDRRFRLKGAHFTPRSNTILKQRVDWRDKNIITPVRNQDKCGACWAFSTIETIEAMYALKTGVLEEWSVQQLVDCAPEPNLGCEGGDTCLTIEWLYQHKVNIVPAKDYPFTGNTGLCKIKKSSRSVRVAGNSTCNSFVGEEEQMLYYLSVHGPLVVAVDASGWQDYLGGIIQFHCENERNHAVQIVGYDLTGEVPYYIIRNSWGTQFGNDGYLYVAIGKNLCGIAEEVSTLDVL